MKNNYILICLLIVVSIDAPDAEVSNDDADLERTTQTTEVVGETTNQRSHLIAVMPQYFPPIYSVSRNNVLTGYGVAFMELVAEHCEIDIEYNSAESWPQTFEIMEDGRADIIPNLGITQNRTDDYVFTKPYDEFKISIFVKQGVDNISNLNDLKGKLVGIVERNRGQSILAQNPNIKLAEYSSLGQLVAGLKSDEIDAAVYPHMVFESFTASLGISEAFKHVGEPLEIVKRAIAVRKELAGLIPLLNRGIDLALSSPEHAIIYERWHPSPPPYWNARRVKALLMTLLVVFVVIFLSYRYLITRKQNKELIHYSNFNKAVLNATSDGIITIDSNCRIIAMNTFAETLFDEPLTVLRQQSILELLPGNDFRRLFEKIIEDEPDTDPKGSISKSFSLEMQAKRRDQEIFPVRIGLVRMDTNETINVVCNVRDQSRTREAEKRADQLINNDPLTGIMNQRGLIEKWSSDVRRGVDTIYCFCIGLTHMTQINSLYNRHVGDDVLVQVANALTVAFDEDEQVQVCRSSGNHFIVSVIDPAKSIEKIAKLINNSIKSLKITTIDSIETTSINKSSPLTIDFAVGAAIYPDHATNSTDLINNAEIAYARAKRHAYDDFSLYTKKFKDEQLEGETAYQRVKHALRENRISLYYQPIQTIHSQKIEYYEALVRMHDEDGTLIIPEDIIPIAEQFNIITQVDYQVIKLALEKLTQLKDNHPEVAISVNLSAKHIGDEKLYKLIESEMSKHNINFTNLTFEITESKALQNFAAARNFMSKLKRFGCHFALDDFGVGFTSFAQLRLLPVDIIKIDGMFIKELGKNKEDEVFVKAMTEIAHALGKKVVAEYVENEKIYEVIKKHGVDYAQGYFVGKPHPNTMANSDREKNIRG